MPGVTHDSELAAESLSATDLASSRRTRTSVAVNATGHGTRRVVLAILFSLSLGAPHAEVVSAAARSANDESAQGWFAQGKEYVARAKALAPITNRAKSVILFIGDGIGVCGSGKEVA